MTVWNTVIHNFDFSIKCSNNNAYKKVNEQNNSNKKSNNKVTL